MANNADGTVEMIECLVRDGIFVVKDGPQNDAAIIQLLNSIGTINTSTHYGRDELKVCYQPNVDGRPMS